MPRYLSPRAPRRIARALIVIPGAATTIGLLLADVVVFLSFGTPGGVL